MMLPVEVWREIEKMRAVYIDMGVLRRRHYDHWSQRLHMYMESLDEGNEAYTAASKTFLALIEKLEVERDEKFPEEV